MVGLSEGYEKYEHVTRHKEARSRVTCLQDIIGFEKRRISNSKSKSKLVVDGVNDNGPVNGSWHGTENHVLLCV